MSSVIPQTYTPVSQTPHAASPQQQEAMPPSAFAGAPQQQLPQQPVPMPQFGAPGEHHAAFYFSHLSFSGTLARTFRLFFDHWRVFVLIAAVHMVPLIIFTVTITTWIASIMVKESHDTSYHPRHLHMLYFLTIVQLLLYGAITVLGRGAMIRAVAEVYSGKIPSNSTWRDCMQHIWSMGQLMPLIVTSVMVIGGIGLIGLVPYVLLMLSEFAQNSFMALVSLCGILAWLIFAMYAYSLCILVSPVIVIENKLNPVQALHRSKEIVTGTHCYVYLCLLVMYIINHFCSGVAHAIFVGHDGTAGTAAMLVLTSFEGILASFVPQLIFFPLHTILEAVMYVNIRVQRESLDRDTFVRELEDQDRLPTSDIASRYGGTTLNMDGMWKSIVGNGNGLGGSEPSTDYRQVPLMEGEQSYEQPPQQQFV